MIRKLIKKLTKVEEEIMQLVWKIGPTTVSNLISHIHGKKPPHSTISSVMRILEDKGFLDHKTYGKTYEYYPIVDRKDYFQFSIKGLVKDYLGGNMKQLVSFLVENDSLSLKDIEDIKSIIKDRKS